MTFDFQYEYALRHLYALLNLCEKGYTADRYSLLHHMCVLKFFIEPLAVCLSASVVPIQFSFP